MTIVDLFGRFDQFEKCSRNVHLDKFVEDATRETFAKSVTESSIGPLDILLVGPEVSNVGCNLLVFYHSKTVDSKFGSGFSIGISEHGANAVLEEEPAVNSKSVRTCITSEWLKPISSYPAELKTSVKDFGPVRRESSRMVQKDEVALLQKFAQLVGFVISIESIRVSGFWTFRSDGDD